MKYGLPYKGSKNKLAERIIDLFPKKENLYDLFCGGGAITHCALLGNKFKKVYMNDINPMCTQLFVDSVKGKYKNETRWISREDFYKLKDTDPYIAFCWSFGNKLDNYLYSKEIEPWKKALHYARVFNDFSLLEKMNIKTDGTPIDVKKQHEEIKQKYIIWYCKEVLHSELDTLELQKNLTERIKKNSEELRNYLIDGLKKANKKPCDVNRYLGTKGMAVHYFGKSQWEFPTREVYIKLQDFLVLPISYEEIYGLQELLQRLKRLQSLQSLESLHRLQRLESLESFERLESSNLSYDEIEIKPNSIIYCDIPYKNTDQYNNQEFDYEKFYDWCKKQTELLFISSYEMPDDFISVADFEHRGILSATANNKVVEKIFIPKHQIKMFEENKTTLF